MATAMAIADGDTTERVVAMVNGNPNGNGPRQRQWTTAMMMLMELATTTEMVTAICARPDGQPQADTQG
jgi:hypothetical protein